jgi:hypothetical protein
MLITWFISIIDIASYILFYSDSINIQYKIKIFFVDLYYCKWQLSQCDKILAITLSQK